MVTLYITRHGQTEWNVAKRMQGWADSPLTEEGKLAAAQLGERLKEIPFEAVYSSTSGRTKQTTDIIMNGRDIPSYLKEDLREMNVGEWEGMYSVDIQKEFPEQCVAFYENPANFQSASGENFHQLKERVIGAIDSIIKNHPTGNVLIVTHGVVKKCIINHFSGAPLDELWDPPFIHGTSLTTLEVEGNQHTLQLIGDTSHIQNEELVN